MLLAGLIAFALPAIAHAQADGRVYRVAHAVPTRVDRPGPFFEAVRDRLAERGFVQGRNLDLRFFARRADAAREDAPLAEKQVPTSTNRRARRSRNAR
jgi:hypothetical protein